jgi:hypothetical protein
MKKLLLLSALFIFAFSCNDRSDDNPLPAYTIEGKWLWSPSENRADANTMYEFVDGNVYTYYCNVCPGDDAYWNSLESTDRIPGSDTYIFDGDDTLIWDEISRLVSFECDGGKLIMDGQFSHLWRLSSDCN